MDEKRRTKSLPGVFHIAKVGFLFWKLFARQPQQNIREPLFDTVKSFPDVFFCSSNCVNIVPFCASPFDESDTYKINIEKYIRGAFGKRSKIELRATALQLQWIKDLSRMGHICGFWISQWWVILDDIEYGFCVKCAKINSEIWSRHFKFTRVVYFRIAPGSINFVCEKA